MKRRHTKKRGVFRRLRERQEWREWLDEARAELASIRAKADFLANLAAGLIAHAEQQERVRAYLADGPRRRQELTDQLASVAGEPFSEELVNRILSKVADVIEPPEPPVRFEVPPLDEISDEDKAARRLPYSIEAPAVVTLEGAVTI